ncbi:MAG: hypothetical protein ACT4OU_07505 [Hyphomicrobium sp.]
MASISFRRARFALAVVAGFSAASATPSVAQVGPGGAINPQRDCQTVVTCNFKRSGSYRGCVSSYSCRVCSFVPARCSIGGRRGKTCRELRCGWGA